MSTMTKVFVVLTAVFSIALSCIFIAAAAQWNNARDLMDKYQLQRDAIKGQLDAAQALAKSSLAMKDDQIADLQSRVQTLEKDKKSLADDLATARADLASARNKAENFEAGRTKLQEILDVTMSELKATQAQQQRLVTDNIEAQTRIARQNERILELTTSVQILTDESRNLQEKLFACERGSGPRISDAGTTVRDRDLASVRPEPTVVSPIQGQVLQVNGTYASVNVGESSGVVPGMTFVVWREGVGYLGDLVVETVRPKECGGKLTGLALGEIRSGDNVVFGLN